MARAATALAGSSPSTYLEKRKLAPPFVGPLQLAGFILGVVISGAFTGWNTGLSFGFINMAIAVGLATVMYLTLVLSVCEMCSALPFASGPASFAQAALNSGAGALTGGVYAASYTLLSATVLVSLGNFITAALPENAQVIPSAFYWLPLAALALALNSRPRLLFRGAVVLSCYSCLLLLGYLGLTFLIRPTKRNAPTNPINGDTSLLSLRSIIAAFPFACWLYVGIESFPTASEEARKIFHTAPTAGLYASFFLAFSAITLLTTAPQLGGQLASVAIAPGPHLAANTTAVTSTAPVPMLADFSHSNHPLLDNVLNLICSRFPSPLPTWCQPAIHLSSSSSTDFFHKGHPLITVLVLLTLLPPLFLSLITGTYAAARHIYTLSRAGVLPTCISKTSPHGAPNYATLIILAAGMGIAGLIKLLNWFNMGGKLFVTLVSGRAGGMTVVAATADDGVGGFFCPTGDLETSLAILQVSSWLACVSYVLEFASYILLYLRVAQLPRPFVSPLGIGGAAVGLVLALALGVIGPVFVDPYFYGILLACAVAWMVGAVAYWMLVAKARMADSPEKIFVRLQIQQLYGRSFPGPAVSHPPRAGGHPGGQNGDDPRPDRRLDGSDRGLASGTRTVLLSPQVNSATQRVPSGTQRDWHCRHTGRHHVSQGTVCVNDHSMPTLAMNSRAGTSTLPAPAPSMCAAPAVPGCHMPTTPVPPTAPTAPALTSPPTTMGHDPWDWATALRLPTFLRYGSAVTYRPAASSEVVAMHTLATSASTTLMDQRSTLPLSRDWTGWQVDEVTAMLSHTSDASNDGDGRCCEHVQLEAQLVQSATHSNPRLNDASPEMRSSTASSEALFTRDSGVTDLFKGRWTSLGAALMAAGAEGELRPN